MDNAQALQQAKDALAEVAGCFEAAYIEGLSDVLAETEDSRLKDLVQRRILFANDSACNALAALATVSSEAQQEQKLTLALPDYDKRRIVIASDEVIDGERIVCVAIKDASDPRVAQPQYDPAPQYSYGPQGVIMTNADKMPPYWHPQAVQPQTKCEHGMDLCGLCGHPAAQPQEAGQDKPQVGTIAHTRIPGMSPIGDVFAHAAQKQEAGQEPTGDQLRAIVKSLRGSSDGPSLTEVAHAGWMAALSAQPVQDKPQEAGQARGWRVRERRNAEGELLDCFVEAPAENDMPYGMEILGDDYEGFGGVARKLEHCNLIVSLVNGAQAAPSVPDGYMRVLRAVRECLQRENERGAIADTLWYSNVETLFDFIDAHLNASASAPSVSADSPAAANEELQKQNADLLQSLQRVISSAMSLEHAERIARLAIERNGGAAVDTDTQRLDAMEGMTPDQCIAIIGDAAKNCTLRGAIDAAIAAQSTGASA